MNKKITFATNTAANTLEYTKLLLKSLKDNLDGKEHEILVFIDSDNDGTLDYLRSIKKDFYDLTIITHKVKPVVGPEINQNLIVENAKHDIVSYLQTDMVISKHYDTYLLQELEEDMILSSTRIEPPLHGESPTTFTKDFGLSPDEFRYDEFLSFADTVRSDKTLDYFFAPYTFYKQAWQKFGGYDTIFRRSRCDSDLVQRCMYLGIKLKQTFLANVYHFTCVSSRGKNWFDPNSEEAKQRVATQNIADQVELMRFIRKWGRFNHGEEKILRYDMDLVWKSGSGDDLVKIEHHFNRIWVPTQEVKDQLVAFYKARNEHQYANYLLKFSEEDWNNAKKFYNQTDYESLVCVGEPRRFNIKIEVDMTRDANGTLLKDGNVFLNNLVFLSDLIAPYEAGIYELGCAEIHLIHKVNLANNHIVVENPPFDYSLLTIE